MSSERADRRGARMVVRLLAGVAVDAAELAELTEPWGELCEAVRGAEKLSRVAALKAALVGHPERARVGRAIAACGKAGADAARPGRSGLVPLAGVVARPVRWLWPGRVPLGKLTVLDGDPGLGKSALTLDLAARVSAGRPMPDESRADRSASSGQALAGPRGVVLLSAEDGLDDTIRPRLEVAGAELGRISALTSVRGGRPGRGRGAAPSRGMPRLPTLDDLEALREAIEEVSAALVIVDPIMAYLPGGVDSSKDSDVRSVLARLAGLAEAEGAAVLVVRHLNKSGRGGPLYRGGGSIGIIGAARSGLLVAPDPDDETGARRVLASSKVNLAARPDSLAYHVEAGENGALRVVWEGTVGHTAASLIDGQRERDGGERGALAEAQEVLRQILASGPKNAAVVQTEARAAGISERTLRRARKVLGAVLTKEGYQGAWTWALAEKPDERTVVHGA